MGQLDGKVAVVTGAGSGQGRAAALLFAEEGADVIAADISGDEATTAADGGSAVTAVHCDVSEPADVEATIGEAVRRHGRLDIVCNVAGIAGVNNVPLADLEPDEWDRVQNVNLRGVFLGLKYGLPAIIASGGGSIVNWGSIGGLVASGLVPSYSSSKAGVIHLTRNAAVQYGTSGVRINCICPGFILTPMFDKGFGDQPRDVYDAALETMRNKATLGREGYPEEVAQVALWLCSPGASFVNGVALPVDGGWSIRSY